MVLIRVSIYDIRKVGIQRRMKGYRTVKIYKKIFTRLDELHMSQIELSKKTGIATSTISDWRKKKINPQAERGE